MYRYLLKKKLRCLLLAALLVISGATGTLFSLIMSALVDCAGKSTKELLAAFLLSAVYVVTSVMLQASCGYMKALIISDARRRLKNDLFTGIMNKSITDFEAGNTAEYINELCGNVNLYERVYYNNIIASLQCLISFATASIITIMAQPLMLLLMIFLALITMAVTRLTAEPLERSTEKASKSVEEYTAEIKDDFCGFRPVYSFGVIAHILAKHEIKNRKMEDAKRQNVSLKLLCSYMGQFVGLFSTVLVMAAASFFSLRGMFSAGMVIAFGHLIGNIVSPITRLPSIAADFRASKPLRARFEKILAQKASDGAYKLFGLQDAVALEDLSFGYQKNREVLHQLSFRFQAGRHYAVIGSSGSGKSTMLSLLLGYYSDYDGRICFDGTELRQLKRSCIGELIGIVSQDTFLFHDTIQNNITLFNEKYTMEEIISAVEQAGLKGLADSLPDGLSTIISENGRNFSGGEKQRISLARVLLRQNKILLFDEFTANLDQETAKEIEERLLLMKDRLIITVTHRLNPEILRQYDQILVLAQGRIAEAGAYDELKAQGRHFKLY